MKYAVDRIENNFAILENIQTKEKKTIELVLLPIVKEKDILIFEEGRYKLDSKEKENRVEIIKEKLARLKKKKEKQ